MIINSHDGWNEKFVPALKAAGAVLDPNSKYHVRQNEGDGWTLNDWELLESTITEIGKTQSPVRFIGIDRFDEYLPDRILLGQQRKIAVALNDLDSFAIKKKVCILLTAEFNGRSVAAPIETRIKGLAQWISNSRACFQIAQGKRPYQRTLVPCFPGNDGHKSDALAFSFDECVIHDETAHETVDLVWGGSVGYVDPDEASNRAYGGGRRYTSPKSDEAKAFLHDLLKHGPLLVRDIKATAEKRGLAWKTVNNCAREIGVERSGKGRGPHHWMLSDLSFD